ncbi:MAG: PAS domain-containing protein [Alphaproteobacteria bacterium]|nr:PAS domain-containing protein [Alphaproteobacteria bacterium]
MAHTVPVAYPGCGVSPMMYADFERAIASPALKDVAMHWNAVRQGRRMPRWTDIIPSRIAAHLSLVWSFKYDAARDIFTGRLVGERIARHIGKDFRGLSLAEAYPADALPWVAVLFKRVVSEPALYAHAGPLFHQMGRPHPGERILLPLSEDGAAADGVLGATVLHEATAMPLTLMAPDHASEHWFSLAG